MGEIERIGLNRKVASRSSDQEPEALRNLPRTRFVVATLHESNQFKVLKITIN
jgi:hypothetical protein